MGWLLLTDGRPALSANAEKTPGEQVRAMMDGHARHRTVPPLVQAIQVARAQDDPARWHWDSTRYGGSCTYSFRRTHG